MIHKLYTSSYIKVMTQNYTLVYKYDYNYKIKAIFLFIPKRHFFQGAKLSKVALPCSKLLKESKPTTRE
jgi:hypothetical protein